MSDSNGNPLPNTTVRYLPFGSYRGTPPDPTLTDRGFTGHKHNNDLGLIYMNARYYLPGIGRFLSADTLIPDPSNPQSFNRYAYVLNNPLRFTDPSGHCAENGDEACWSLLEELERIYEVDIQDELLWNYEYLEALRHIFEQYSEFVGSQAIWVQTLKNSAQWRGVERYIIKGTLADMDISRGGRCTTGCTILGEARFNLSLIFSDDNPGALRYGDWYKEPFNNGLLTMAHEFSHALFGVSDSFIVSSYITSRGWMQDPATGIWTDAYGIILDYDNPEHYFVHVVALYVSAGNRWAKIDLGYFVQRSITIYEEMWVAYARLDFFTLGGR